MQSDFIQTNIAFERAVLRMQKDLQYLANAGNVSQAFIAKQNLIIKHLIAYQKHTQDYITYLENENTQVRIERREKVKELQDRIIAFEAICILHGIIDFPAWLYWGKTHLVKQAVDAKHKYGIRLPVEWRDKIEALPDNQRKTLKQILFKNERLELKQLLKSLSKKRKLITSKMKSLPEEQQQRIKSLLKL